MMMVPGSLTAMGMVLHGLGLVRAATTHDIAVGKGASLSFQPNTLTASIGDTINFHFYNGSGPHSVISGPFSSPCQPSSTSFYSGYIPGDLTGDTVFSITIKSTDAIWFYCSLAAHCLEGMVGVINPPEGKTVSDYVEAASGQRAGSLSALQGGVLTTISGSGSSSPTTSKSVVLTSSSVSGSGSGSGSSSSSSGGGSTGSMSITSTGSSGTTSPPGISVETTMPTSTGTGVSRSGTTTTTSQSRTSSSGGIAATSTPSGAGQNANREFNVMLGLGFVTLTLVALMA